MASFITRLCCSCFLLLICIASTTPCLGFTSYPPWGNSIALSATTLDGKITYSCRNGMWLPVSIAATLVNSENEQKPVGSYLRTFLNISPNGSPRSFDNDDNAGTWSLINSDGDAAESGHSSSLVSGMVISSLLTSTDSATYMRDFLSQARLHQFDGEASRVSYIMQKNAVISNELPAARCTQDENDILNVTYKADYLFWKQDMVPPAMIPSQIAVDSNRERPVEAFFAAGTVGYAAAANWNTWAFKGASGRLYDLPGGMELGSFHMNGSLLCLWTEAAASNYASACAKPLANIVADSLALPWFLMTITNSTRNMITFGSMSSIQMVSTFGGVAPSTPPNTLDEANQSPFTAIFWIYMHQ